MVEGAPKEVEGIIPIRATHGLTYNGFSMVYRLTGGLRKGKLGADEFGVSDLEGVSITYADDATLARDLKPADAERLVQALYEESSHAQFAGSHVPGGEEVLFSAPMKQLLLLGESARPGLLAKVADPAIQNEVVLVLGAVGDEATVPIVIDHYPSDALPPERRNPFDPTGWKIVCFTHALGYLTEQPIGIGRTGADYLSENGERWKGWWEANRGTFKVHRRKVRHTWMPTYPDLSEHGIEEAREQFTRGGDSEGERGREAAHQ